MSPTDASPAAANNGPPYAVIFVSQLRPDAQGYADAAERMMELVRAQPGFRGVESVRSGDGLGVTVSYWDSLDAIAAWKKQPEHAAIQQIGRSRWYSRFAIQVCRIERAADFCAADDA